MRRGTHTQTVKDIPHEVTCSSLKTIAIDLDAQMFKNVHEKINGFVSCIIDVNVCCLVVFGDLHII